MLTDGTATVWSHELMHIGQIGEAASPLDGFIIDQPVKGWPGIPYSPGAGSNTLSYGDFFTKWLAQSPGNLITDAIDNADNYARKYPCGVSAFISLERQPMLTHVSHSLLLSELRTIKAWLLSQ